MNIYKLRHAILTLLIFTLSIAHLSAQIKWNSAYQAYIDQYKDLAIEQMLKYNIPASITLSQGLLESGAANRQTIISESNVMVGPVVVCFTMMMHAESALELTIIPDRVLKTIAVFLLHNHATHACFLIREPITRVGHVD